MYLNEKGNGRRIRCPICNCMFTIDKEDLQTSTAHGEYSIDCPQCKTTLYISTRIEPKMDIFLQNK